MKFKQVYIENYKSLLNIRIDLQDVNLFIGANNSGKSNVIQAIKDFSYIIACSQNGYRQDVEAFLPKLLNKRNKSKIDSSMRFKLNDGIRRAFGCLVDVEIADDSNKISLDELKKLNYHIQHYLIYNIQPYKIKEAYPLMDNDLFVQSDGSNLVSFFDSMRDLHPQVMSKIEDDLFRITKEFKSLRFEKVKVENGEKATYKRLGLFDKHERLYWADELSEGVLYFLALLAIIYQPNPPELLLIEEPEKGIHPRRIHEFIELLFLLAKEKDVQVILTTHSTIVVDQFSDVPECITVFEKEGEVTKVKNLYKDIIIPDNKKANIEGLPEVDYMEALGEHWALGFLGGVP